MQLTVEEHYHQIQDDVPIADDRHFDGDLRTIFAGTDANAETAGTFLRAHRREIVTRVAYWTGEPTTVVAAFIDFLTRRADALGLRTGSREASTLIELTAFGTAVIMNYRYTHTLGERPEEQEA